MLAMMATITTTMTTLTTEAIEGVRLAETMTVRADPNIHYTRCDVQTLSTANTTLNFFAINYINGTQHIQTADDMLRWLQSLSLFAWLLLRSLFTPTLNVAR